MEPKYKRFFCAAAYFVTFMLISVTMPYFPNNYTSLIFFISIIIGGLLLTLYLMNRFKSKWDPKLDEIKKELRSYKIGLMVFFYSTIFIFHLLPFTEIVAAIFSLVEYIIYAIISLLPIVFYGYAGLKLHRQLKRLYGKYGETNPYWLIMLELGIFIPYGFAALSQSIEFLFLSITITIICFTLCGIGLFKNYFPDVEIK